MGVSATNRTEGPQGRKTVGLEPQTGWFGFPGDNNSPRTVVQAMDAQGWVFHYWIRRQSGSDRAEGRSFGQR
jgi:hypothetical protein